MRHVWRRDVRLQTGRLSHRWGCASRHLRGKAICDNALETWLADTEDTVLDAIEQQVLNAAVLETAMAKALAILDQGGQDDGAASLRQELARVEAECARLAAAIASGGSLESLLATLHHREQRRAHLRSALAAHEREQAAQRRPEDALAAMRHVLAD